MQTSPQIEFQGITASPQIRDAIEARIVELERRFGRLTACRVVLKAPGPHHRKGGLYHVHIRLILPEGREVNISRTPLADERHADLTFALDDAFRHARRRLQDQVRLMQGRVKRHADRTDESAGMQ